MPNDSLYQALMSRFDSLEDRIDRRFDSMEERSSNIEADISRIDVTLVKQNKDLEHHIQRTAAAEQRIEMHQAAIENVNANQDERLHAAESFVKEMKKLAKWAAWIVGTLVSGGLLDRIIEKFF